MTPYNKTQGIVIRTRKHSETSKLLTVYTRGLGRINAVARGARKIKSRFGSSLEVFTESKFMFYKQPSASLYVVSQSQIMSAHSKLTNEPASFAAASVMADFLYTHTVQGEENPELYYFFRSSLKELESSSAPGNVLLSFMLKFLSVSGYRLNLSACSSCGGSCTDSLAHRLSAKHGGVICETCSKRAGDSVVISRSALKVLSYLQEKGYGSVSTLKVSGETNLEIRKVVNNFLRYNFDYELKSLKVMESMGVYSTVSPEDDER